MKTAYKKLHPHFVYCNAFRTEPIGGNGCCCVVVPALEVTPEDIENGKTFTLDPNLQPDSLTDFGAWWVKLFSWLAGAVRCRERQLKAANCRLIYSMEEVLELVVKQRELEAELERTKHLLLKKEES